MHKNLQISLQHSNMAPLHKCNKHISLSGQNSIASNKSLIMMAAAVHHDEAAESGLHAGGERSLRHHRLHRHYEGPGGSAAWTGHPDGEVRFGAKPKKLFFSSRLMLMRKKLDCLSSTSFGAILVFL